MSTTEIFADDGSLSLCCQGRALAPVLPPDYILPKTYLRDGFLARATRTGPLWAAFEDTVPAALSERF